MLRYTGSHEPRLFVQNLMCCLSARRFCNYICSLRILSRPLSARKQNAIRSAFRWRADSGPRLDTGWAYHLPGRPLNSFAVSRAANNIDPDQTEPTLLAKIFLKDKTDKVLS